MILLPLFAWILALGSLKVVESAASSVSASSSKTTITKSVSTATTALIPSAVPLPQQDSISVSLSSASNSNVSDAPNNHRLTRENIIEIHALLMWIGFLICPSIGVFIARFLKRKLGHNWFRMHATIMTFGSLAAVSGVLVICLYTPSSSSSSSTSRNFQSSHAKLGLVILSLLGLQIVLGVMSNFLFNVKRSSIPMQDKMHWWMGRLLAILALVQIQAGWSLYQALGYKLSPLVLVTHYFIIAVIIGCFMTAEFKLGPFYHVSADHKRFSIA